MLALGVGCLVGIDIVILTVYTLVEVLTGGSLIATRISNVELPEMISGVSSKFMPHPKPLVSYLHGD